MNIIHIPHTTLRQKARPIDRVDKKLHTFVNELAQTLAATRNPKGIAVAAPQVDKLWRVFTTAFKKPLTVINPVISKHAKIKTLHEDQNGEPFFEGCLSMPKIWGPVWRWEWVEVEFDELVGDELVRTTRRFDGFEGRVMQHEYDHLEGILFTDRALADDLPVYQEQIARGTLGKAQKKTVELAPDFVRTITLHSDANLNLARQS